MSSPLQRLRRLPWLVLALISILTVFGILVLELLLWIGAVRFALIRDALSLLYTPPLNLAVELIVAAGVGALAVYLLEVICPQVVINAGVLWALLLCLLLAAYVKSMLSLPISLLNPTSQTFLIGVVLGVFWKGKSYWR
jgi:signal transduction histidine kinase